MNRYVFRNLLHVRGLLFGVESKNSKTPWSIPSDIVEIIFHFLSDIDQFCFALSSKRLLADYKSYANRRGIFPQAVSPRLALIYRLQNERWEYCFVCQRLHRYFRWWPRLFVKKCKPKPGSSLPNCKAWCFTEDAGKADLCPCSSITFHQKVHPKDYIQSRKEASASSTTSESWRHFCNFRHPLAEVVVKTEVGFNELTKSFEVENQFRFRTSPASASLERFRKISFRLSRYETEFWLRSFLDEADAEFFIGNESSNWYQCHGWNHTGTRPYTFFIVMRRDLGGIGWPCEKWERNRYEYLPR